MSERDDLLGRARVRRSRLASDLISVGKIINQRGWCPATGGNFSVRLNEQAEHEYPPSCLVTASGVHKGELTEHDFIEVDLRGNSLESSTKVRPSAETLVHVALYRLDDEIGAVLHAHSVPNTLLSQLCMADRLTITGFEMQKSLRGVMSHEEILSIEVFDNTQDMTLLATEVEKRWHQRGKLNSALLVRGHGVYTWGRDLSEAWRHMEGLEFLLECELELAKLGLSQNISPKS